ncbi:MAG: hypothetical protein CMF49_02680 [Legionellales bacterium]|nr:hypothetical protein [Legionellales bacterium]
MKETDKVTKEKLIESLSVTESYLHEVLTDYASQISSEHFKKALHKANIIIEKGQKGQKISDMLAPLILAEYTMRAVKASIVNEKIKKEA